MILAAGIGVFLFFGRTGTIEVTVDPVSSANLNVPEATTSGTAAKPAGVKTTTKLADIENQKPLANPPKVIKAIYLTSWSGGSATRIKYLINLAKTTQVNAAVIDIKDYSGYVAYDIGVPDVIKYNAKEIRIPLINTLIKQLHDAGIYVIARVTIFQDPRLALARPDLTVKSKKTGGSWLDNKKINWIDPAAKDAWDYDIAIAKDAASRGFDEINFDYIRFPSDGDLNDMSFTFWDGKSSKSSVLKSFFKYLREQMGETKLSADLFGLAAINHDDLGIGQVIENAYQYFDFVCPMVYPSHYANGFLGYKNPALYPYEVVKYSLDAGVKRLMAGIPQPTTGSSTTVASSTVAASVPFRAKLRPWLQDFNLGATYDAAMVGKEIQAVEDSLTGDNFSGWLMWNPSNVYSL